MLIEDLAITIGVISAITGGLVVCFTVHYQRKTMHFNTMMHVFERLGPENIKARDYVLKKWESIAAYLEKLEHQKGSDKEAINKELAQEINKLFLEPESEFQKNAERVLRDFNEIGILIYKDIDQGKMESERDQVIKDPKLATTIETKRIGAGYLERQIFFNAYASSVINCWLSLASFVRITGSRYVFFDALFYDAKKHRDVKYKIAPVRMEKESIWKLNEYILREKILNKN